MLIALTVCDHAYCGDIQDAAANDDTQTVKALLQDHPDLVNSSDDDGWTALHWAAAYGYKDVVEVLLAGGADVNARERDGFTPSHLAAGNGQNEVVELLHEHGAPAEPAPKPSPGWSMKNVKASDLTSSTANGAVIASLKQGTDADVVLTYAAGQIYGIHQVEYANKLSPDDFAGCKGIRLTVTSPNYGRLIVQPRNYAAARAYEGGASINFPDQQTYEIPFSSMTRPDWAQGSGHTNAADAISAGEKLDTLTIGWVCNTGGLEGTVTIHNVEFYCADGSAKIMQPTPSGSEAQKPSPGWSLKNIKASDLASNAVNGAVIASLKQGTGADVVLTYAAGEMYGIHQLEYSNKLSAADFAGHKGIRLIVTSPNYGRLVVLPRNYEAGRAYEGSASINYSTPQIYEIPFSSMTKPDWAQGSGYADAAAAIAAGEKLDTLTIGWICNTAGLEGTVTIHNVELY